MAVPRVRPFIMLILVVALLLGVMPASGTTPTDAAPLDPLADGDLGRTADEEPSVIEVTVPDRDELDRLVETGVDLDHHVHAREDGIEVHAVVTPNEVAALTALGFEVGDVVHAPEDTDAALAEREATIVDALAENEAFAAAAYDQTSPDVSDVKILRADYYTTLTGQFLSVEARWANGQTASSALTVQRDSGPGTAMGSGGQQNITRFVDAGAYLYHRGASSVSTRPDYIRITSPTGDVAVAKVEDWLPLGEDPYGDDVYYKDFVSSYMTPTDLYERIHQLAAEFPQISEIVELPHKTNGYRRKAQALLGTANANRVGVDSLAWGHEGGNDVTIQTVNPGAASSPLTVSVVGNDITVSLATNAAGSLTSTAAQVRNAINAHPAASQLVLAHTYRGNAGNGVVPAGNRIRLNDFLNAPDSVSREPHPVYALRIGRHRDGSRPGVLAYAQEHAREWVPPLVTIETAERLLRNYAHHGPTKQLVNNLDIWIAPSINPDGGHYSFYNFASQRRTMTRHCPVTGNYDLNARNSWGVDTNRNYDEYSLFDGYSGASTSCTSDTFAGPSELSEPENRNVDWMASQPNMKFAMNLHSSGNYFMWSPGSYRTPGRITAPRPTLEEESFFWGASARILTEIKRHRGLSVTPARTGPISDVLYSAAGNSGDMLWYKYRLYAWNFEVGTSFQPPFLGPATGANASQETMEYANGLVELMRVAYDFSRDKVRPESTIEVSPSATHGMVNLRFRTTEPAAVFYTLDGSTPTYDSTLYAGGDIRERGELLTVMEGSRVHWFSVDSAGNVEKNYRPDGRGRNFNTGVASVGP
jgi:hypothetical protein